MDLTTEGFGAGGKNVLRDVVDARLAIHNLHFL